MSPDESRCVEELVACLKQGAQPGYIFFWGHTPKDPGRLDHSCFSN